jgi:type II secretory pathway component HofQ
VAFHDAPLQEALRMLAEVADVDLVVSEPLSQPVTLELRQVDPLEAMEALAAAHRLRLARRGDLVVVDVPR